MRWIFRLIFWVRFIFNVDALSFFFSRIQSKHDTGLSKDANDDAKVNEIVLESLSKVLENFPDSSEKDRLLTDSINWSKNAKLKQSSSGAGSPLLHAIAAKACVKSGNVRLAFKHFLYAQSARDFAKLVCSQISKGHTSEYDLFVLRTVLSYLCAGAEVKEAELLLREIETRAKRNAKDFPLLRFLNRLFVLIPQGDDADELFHLLVQVYAPGFSSRDPSIYKLIKTIDIKFFGGVPPTSAAASRSPFGGGNMMNMMRMMMGK